MLGLEIEELVDEYLLVCLFFWCYDLMCFVDLFEEIVCIYGYEKIFEDVLVLMMVILR